MDIIYCGGETLKEGRIRVIKGVIVFNQGYIHQPTKMLKIFLNLHN